MLRIALFLSGGVVVMLFIAEYYGVVNITDTQLLHATDIAASAAKDSVIFIRSVVTLHCKRCKRDRWFCDRF